MRETITISFLILLFFTNHSGQSLSSEAQFSLLTCDSGKELYSTFGHSAVRLYDPVNDIDKVYNWGTFDYDEPNFGLKFLRGKLLYALGVNTFEEFLLEYQYFERSVWEQKLDMSHEKKEALYQFLSENYKPENRYYLYDFFFDNCSSRIRDVFEELFDDHHYDQLGNRKVSYRQLLDEYLSQKKWLDFGIDLIIGSVADQNADWRAQMFLPDYLHDNLESFRYDESGETKTLITSERLVLSFEELQIPKNIFHYLNPLVLFILLFALELILFINPSAIQKKALRIYDFLWFITISAGSVLLMVMWFGTDHQACGNNYNLLWFNPLFIVFLFVMKKPKSPVYLRLLQAILIFYLITIFGWTWLPQQFHVATLPILLLMVLKVIRLYRGAACLIPVKAGVFGYNMSPR